MKYTYFILSIVLFSLLSCKKEEGSGGKYSITGKVFVSTYNSTYTVLKSQYYGQAVTVYLIYGDEPVFQTSQKTNYDGTYQFAFLRKGEYTIYVYSKDSTLSSSALIPVIKNVTIGSEKNLTLPNIEIIK